MEERERETFRKVTDLFLSCWRKRRGGCVSGVKRGKETDGNWLDFDLSSAHG